MADFQVYNHILEYQQFKKPIFTLAYSEKTNFHVNVFKTKLGLLVAIYKGHPYLVALECLHP